MACQNGQDTHGLKAIGACKAYRRDDMVTRRSCSTVNVRPWFFTKGGGFQWQHWLTLRLGKTDFRRWISSSHGKRYMSAFPTVVLSCRVQQYRCSAKRGLVSACWENEEKNPMPRIRDFNPQALVPYASPRVQVTWRPGSLFSGRVWEFAIFLPRWLVLEREQVAICTTEDEDLLEDLLERDFGGCTSAPSFLRGIGRRGQALEMNFHRLIIVLAWRWRGTWRYFKALRKELEACSGEEQILILHQEINIV
jgi:hypothetical protein